MSGDYDWMLLSTLLVAAILEEVVFRAGVHEALLRRQERAQANRNNGQQPVRMPGWSWPNVATAGLFAAAHLLARTEWLALASVPAALLLGAVYEHYRRLWPCVALHAGFNSLWFFGAAFLPAALLH